MKNNNNDQLLIEKKEFDPRRFLSMQESLGFCLAEKLRIIR